MQYYDSQLLFRVLLLNLHGKHGRPALSNFHYVHCSLFFRLVFAHCRKTAMLCVVLNIRTTARDYLLSVFNTLDGKNNKKNYLYHNRAGSRDTLCLLVVVLFVTV